MIKNAVILAAGQGTRLRPLTDEKPKCMVEVNGTPMLKHQISSLKAAGVENIKVVAGYKEEKIVNTEIEKILNPKFAQTNMVYSLFCAEQVLESPFIISYGDIVYQKEVITTLMEANGDIVVLSDKAWLGYWQQRCEDPLDDAESFIKLDENRVQSLGQKAKSIEHVEGQFIGLIKLTKKGWDLFKTAYYNCKSDSQCNSNAWNSGRDLDNAYMTDILNHLAEQGKLYFTEIERGWFEVDNFDDLKVAEGSN